MRTLAIVGRPNVGKSTLFNRLAGKRLALVDDRPGVTRDRREGEGHLGDLTFRIIDTAGFEEADAESLEGRMRQQTERAIAEADLCLFMIDARAGLTPLDEHFAALLRRSGKPVILLANKAEGSAGDAGLVEAYALGFGEPVAISAEHGEGMADLAVALMPFIDEEIAEEEFGETAAEGEGDDADRAGRPLRLAVMGRPNAGKSTLINRLLGEERLLTGPEAGITRDAISVRWMWQDRPVTLHDTAGLRRKARISDKLEKLSVADALRAIQFAEVCVILIDATHPLETQDLRLVELAAEEGRAIVIGFSKWDLIEDRQATLAELRQEVERLLPQVRGVEIVALSAVTGEGLDRLMPAVFRAERAWNVRVSTGQLNRWLQEATDQHPPPAVRGRRIRMRYATQVKTRPPTFVVFASQADEVPESYRRYLVNALRDSFDMPGVPIRLTLRQPKNPYAEKKRR